MPAAEDIVDFWLKKVGPERWFSVDEALDAEIRNRFGLNWRIARDGGYRHWPTSAEGALAYLVLTDQFPRNMFRGHAAAFSTDAHALAAASSAIEAGFDLRTAEPERVFFYMPYEHTEDSALQDRSVELTRTRMTESGPDWLRHALAHREIIRRFGRFPYRNAALDRPSTAEEEAFLKAGGYGGFLKAEDF